MYHCLAGRTPFPETNIMAQMLKHATEAPAPLAALVGEELPAAFQAVLDRFLAKRPDDRYATPAEAAAALAPFATGGAAPAVAKLIPAYRDWLASESQMEVTKTVPQPPAAKPVAAPKPGTAAVPGPQAGGSHAGPAGPAGAPAARTSARSAAGPGRGRSRCRTGDGAGRRVGVRRPPRPAARAERPLWQPDRRDWMMLAAGAFGVLSAVGLGYGLAKALERKDADE